MRMRKQNIYREIQKTYENRKLIQQNLSKREINLLNQELHKKLLPLSQNS